MNEDLYISLLYKKLSGQLTAVESNDLERWLAESEENRQIAHGIEEAWALSGQYQRPDVKIDLDAHFAELEKKMDGEEETTILKNRPVRQMPPRRNWLSIAAALAILISTGFLLRNYFLDTLEMQQLTLGAGETKALTLGDGTKVWVNENSKISYPGVFDKKERRVKLTGEAFFDVTKNAAQPFIIETSNGRVQVLGTSFNVRDYPTEAEMQVEVLTGKVQLSDLKSAQKVILQVNEKGLLNKKNQTLRKIGDQLGNAAAWHTNKLVFKEQKLQEVIQILEQQFQVNIKLTATALQDCPFTSTFEQKSLATILATIETVFGMKMDRKDDQHYLLNGGICP